MTDDREPLEQLLDLALYAPVGLALSALEQLPDLAERGRRELETRLPVARFVGQMVVDQGAKEVRKRFDDLPRWLKEVVSAGLLDLCSSRPAETPGSDAAPAAARQRPASRQRAASPRAGAQPVVPSSAAVEPLVPPVVEPAGPKAQAQTANLPIPGYDTLSASQVVQRLAGLSPSELDAVKSYEAARRGRKTVLLKVAQLRAAS